MAEDSGIGVQLETRKALVSFMLICPPHQVIGIDVYPYPAPEDIPPNLDFQVDDLNSP
jgi:hypothetical protein